MKRFTMALALTCSLSFSVLAGEMPTCGVKSEEPPTTVIELPGNIPTDDVADTSLTISVLAAMLNIFSIV